MKSGPKTALVFQLHVVLLVIERRMLVKVDNRKGLQTPAINISMTVPKEFVKVKIFIDLVKHCTV